MKSFEELIENIQKEKEKKVVAVVAAEDEHAIEAVVKAKETGIVEPVLIGDRNKIISIMENLKVENMEMYEIIDKKKPIEAAEKAVEIVREKKADFLMKGKIQTADILKVVVDKEKGLRTGRVMSHMAIHQMDSYKKLLAVTDGGMNIRPDLEAKKQIIMNAVIAFKNMGVDMPKVALVCAVESMNPKMDETVDAVKLMDMYKNGEITDCILEGPISYDLVMSRKSSEIKGYSSEVVGDADILVVPDIASGNILGKALVYSAGAKMAGFILGAKVPIVLTSRGSTSEEKYLSLVISAAAAIKQN
ncbi:bifunctional enoyl-CoA hydratase/phosphate acetyltransferase [Alkalibacter mobilis]|uniref:bifunctional enoyl-CoA hydratase/phosphate acetyltransferase n=1 Tax=Alkalibacter mobilis TaxID=2787712 RepID=UPI0018A07564|nr:bifunctional enoyl-CoA hydratase/phosphate acetyltransferase [Alkalibacter mobilis]MBF7095604.1 bifunctional enoyl-CoA hydratase/phosphate acetyltransferase [Alkalibacter mobilis]